MPGPEKSGGPEEPGQPDPGHHDSGHAGRASARELVEITRVPNFRRLLGTRLLGQAGDGALQTGLASFVLFSPERQSTPGAVAASFAILLLPYSLLGPFVGVFIDRWSRRQTLVLANVVRAALAIGVAAVLAASVSGWRLGLAALVIIAVNRFVLTALSAALPSTVPGHQLVTANAFAPTLGTFALVVGGGLALALRLALGDGDPAAGAVLLLAATLYLLASQAARRIPRPDLGPHEPVLVRVRDALGDVLRGLIAGLRHVAARRPAVDAFVLMATLRVVYGLVTVQALLLLRTYFHDAADVDAGLSGLGLAAFATGLGALSAAVLTPPAVRRIGRRGWVMAACLIAAAASALLLTRLEQNALIAAGAAIGLATQAAKIVTDSTLQEVCDDSMLGRVFAVYDVLFNTALVGAALLGAVVLPANGATTALPLGVAVVYVVIGLWFSRTSPLNRTPR